MGPEMPSISLGVQRRVPAEPILGVEWLSDDLRALRPRPAAVRVDLVDGDVDPALAWPALAARIVTVFADHQDAVTERELSMLQSPPPIRNHDTPLQPNARSRKSIADQASWYYISGYSEGAIALTRSLFRLCVHEHTAAGHLGLCRVAQAD